MSRRGAAVAQRQPQAAGLRDERAGLILLARRKEGMSRRLLKFSGGSGDDYATFSTAFTNPSC